MMRPSAKTLCLSIVAIVTLCALPMVARAEATVTTDKPDYWPGEVVIITGAGFHPNEVVWLQVTAIDGEPTWDWGTPWAVQTDANGAFDSEWPVLEIALGRTFLLTADCMHPVDENDATPHLHAETTFTDGNPAAKAEQAVNGTFAVPISPVEWVRGNANENKAHYYEGQSIPYRLTLTDLDTSIPHYVEIQWDIRKSGKNAIDYITTFNRCDGKVEPWSGVPGVDPTKEFGDDQEDIPEPAGDPEPQGSFGRLSPEERKMTIWNGTIPTGGLTYISQGSLTVDTSSTQLRIDFTATDPTVVLSWGGHIASQIDWGEGNSAVSIPGSPYHTSLVSLDGKGGSQDMQLAAKAVCVPPTCEITGPDPVCAGATGLVYTCTTDETSPTFAWSITGDGSITSGTTGSSVTVTAGASGSFTLTVVVTRGIASGGCSSTCDKAVTIAGAPTCSITGPAVVFATSVNNTFTGPAGMASYAWSITGDPGNYVTPHSGTGQTFSVDVSADAVEFSEFTVNLTVTDANGCTSSCSKLVEILNVDKGCQIDGPDLVCVDTTGNTYTETITDNVVAYSWVLENNTSGATIVGPTDEQSVSVTAGDVGGYRIKVTLTFIDGGMLSCYIDVTVDEATCSITGPDGPLCPNSTGHVYSGPDGQDSYAWSITGNGSIIGPTDEKTVTVDAGGLCNQDFVLTLNTLKNNCPSSCDKTVKVDDTEDPVLPTLPTGGDLGCNPDPLPSCETVGKATDNCGELDVTCTPGQIEDVGTCGKRQVFTYSAVDACGNDVSQDVTYTWKVDTTPPTITCPPDVEEMVWNGVPCEKVVSITATATDNCDGDLVPTYTRSDGKAMTDPFPGAVDPGQVTTVTVTAEDECGNSASCEVKVTIICVPPGNIRGTKYYDVNANYEIDAGDVTVEGFRINICYTLPDGTTGSMSVFTNENGMWSAELPQGTTFTACEELPPTGGWVQTGPTPGDVVKHGDTVVATANSSRCWEGTVLSDPIEGLDFLNVCTIPATGGYTKGFWTNKNGEAVLEDNPDWLAVLGDYCLRDEDGADFDPASYASFEQWLRKARAKNMGYMLSAQLAACVLNTVCEVKGSVLDPEARLLVDPKLLNCIVGPVTPPLTVQNVIDLAQEELCKEDPPYDGQAWPEDPWRAYWGCLESILDGINNNRWPFLSEEPCEPVYPPPPEP